MRLHSQCTQTRDEEITKQKSTTDIHYCGNCSFCETYFLPCFFLESYLSKTLVSKGAKIPTCLITHFHAHIYIHTVRQRVKLCFVIGRHHRIKFMSLHQRTLCICKCSACVWGYFQCVRGTGCCRVMCSAPVKGRRWVQ